MLARSIMSENVQVVPLSMQLKEISDLMNTTGVEIVAVQENDRLVGVLTNDLLYDMINEGRESLNLTVGEIMTRDAYYCFEDQDIQDVAYMMGYLNCRIIPVLNRNYNLVGTLSLADFARSPSAWTQTSSIFKNYKLTA